MEIKDCSLDSFVTAVATSDMSVAYAGKTGGSRNLLTGNYYDGCREKLTKYSRVVKCCNACPSY